MWCLYSWLYHVAEDQSQSCWSKIWCIMDCYHDLVLYRVILWQCWEVCTALWILTVFSLRQHDLFLINLSTEYLLTSYSKSLTHVLAQFRVSLLWKKDSLQGCLGFPWLAASKKYVLMHAVTRRFQKFFPRYRLKFLYNIIILIGFNNLTPLGGNNAGIQEDPGLQWFYNLDVCSPLGSLQDFDFALGPRFALGLSRVLHWVLL